MNNNLAECEIIYRRLLEKNKKQIAKEQIIHQDLPIKNVIPEKILQKPSKTKERVQELIEQNSYITNGLLDKLMQVVIRDRIPVEPDIKTIVKDAQKVAKLATEVYMKENFVQRWWSGNNFEIIYKYPLINFIKVKTEFEKSYDKLLLKSIQILDSHWKSVYP